MNDFMNQPVPYQEPRRKVTVEFDTGGSLFGSLEDSNSTVNIKSKVEEPPKKKRGRPPKKKNEVQSVETDIVRDNKKSNDAEVIDSPTSYSYMETTGLLKDTLMQIDVLNSELMEEFESVKRSRTMKNKYNTLVGLSQNVSTLLNNKISAIREINNSINKSNDLDYKKAKDRAQAESALNDDKYIADLYQAFISNPQNVQAYQQPQIPDLDPTIIGSGIIRANITDNTAPIDESYLNYVSNLTPQQNLMRYENDPNVKQVVVYDQATGNKFFQIMNIVTGEVIPNLEPYDTEMFMPDTTIDLNTRTARNLNLNETFPVIVINETVANQY
jgi:hypothetical protein